jgi:RNA polymerase sigma-70 factor (ECF subfamily)
VDFKLIVETNQEKVRNICFRYVNNHDDADDIAQEVFIQVYDSLSHFRNESQLSTWIYRIAVNESLDYIHKKRKSLFN